MLQPNIVIPVFSIALITTLYTVVRISRRRALMALDWPASLGFYGFQRYVERYLKAFGWEVRRKDGQEFDFYVRKNKLELFVQCVRSGTAIGTARIVDFSELVAEVARPRPALFVLGDPPSASTIILAKERNVLLIHYKRLGEIAKLNSESVSKFAQDLEKTARKTA